MIRLNPAALLTSALALCTASATLAQPAVAPPASREVPQVVAPAWVAAHLTDPGLVLLQVGERADYDAGHLPGARFIALADISLPPADGALNLELPPVEQLRDTFQKLGVSDGGRVVVYFGKDWVTPTTRVVFTLDYLGYGGRTSIMDGGLPAWRAENRPVTTDAPAAAPAGSFTPHAHPEAVTDAAWVGAHLASPGVVIVDARAPEFYNGTNNANGRIPRPGHIKGAVSVPFETIVDDSNHVKPAAQLTELFRAAGVKPGDTVVTYCHVGQQATLVYLAARLAGFDARLYDGSYQDWSARPELPIEGPAAAKP